MCDFTCLIFTFMHFLKYTSVFSISIGYSLENDRSYLGQCDNIKRERKMKKTNLKFFCSFTLIIHGSFFVNFSVINSIPQSLHSLCQNLYLCLN